MMSFPRLCVVIALALLSIGSEYFTPRFRFLVKAEDIDYISPRPSTKRSSAIRPPQEQQLNRRMFSKLQDVAKRTYAALAPCLKGARDRYVLNGIIVQ